MIFFDHVYCLTLLNFYCSDPFEFNFLSLFYFNKQVKINGQPALVMGPLSRLIAFDPGCCCANTLQNRFSQGIMEQNRAGGYKQLNYQL